MHHANGFIRAAVDAGHADDVLPGDARVAIQCQFTDARCRLILCIDVERTGFGAGPAKGATVGIEIQVRDAGMTVVSRMDADDAGFATGHTGLVTTDAVRFQRQTAVPGRYRAQWLLPFRFLGTALACQQRAAQEGAAVCVNLAQRYVFSTNGLALVCGT